MADDGSTTKISNLDDVLGLGTEQLLTYGFVKNLIDGMVIGILLDGKAYIRTVGEGLSESSIFEIGSITKIFTAELIDILTSQGVMRWNDPVSRYLADNVKAAGTFAAGAEAVTLMDLASHHSGLPLLPPNLRMPDRNNPYGDYSRDDLEQYVSKISLQRPKQPHFEYSNTGFVLLGYAIENATCYSFSKSLTEQLLVPVHLNHTALALGRSEDLEVIQGQTQSGHQARRWTQNAFAPAGALCSTVVDQLSWIKFIIDHPNRKALGYGVDPLDERSVLGWRINPHFGSYYRDGLTGGFSAYIGVDPVKKCGLIVLANRSTVSFVRAISANLERRLRNMPTVPLHGDYGKFKANALELLHSAQRASYAIRLIRSTSAGAHLIDRVRRTWVGPDS